jgi:FkbM family methyltransferase
MEYVKQIARRFFTLDQRRQIADFRGRMRVATTIKPYVRFLNSLPPNQIVGIKEQLNVTGKLDYKDANILMSLDSAFELMRLRSCAKEPKTIEWIETCFRKGDVFYDIGANVGAYSFVARAVTGGDCTIYAFEPSFATFETLCRNIFLNKFDKQITALQVALADETQLLSFNYSDIAAGASLHSVGEAIDQDGQPFTAAYTQSMLCYRLDDLISQFSLSPPNHIKIDTDGAELKVLRGAGQTLAHPALRTILIEVNEKLPSCGEMLDYIKGKGFHVRSRDRAGEAAELYNLLFERDADYSRT